MEHSFITLDQLSYHWPDGTPALSGLTGSIGRGITGLIGANGAGKTTLTRLIAGQLAPTSGRVHVRGRVGVLDQHLPTAEVSVAEAMGIAAQLHALAALEAGDAAEEHFEAIGEDWAIGARACAVLADCGLAFEESELDRSLTTLSGGQAVRVGIAGIMLHRPELAILDEPTNNLDAAGRAAVHELMETWTGSLLIVSHDREILERVERIVELFGIGTRDAAGRERASTMRTITGGYTTYREVIAGEQAAAVQAVSTAAADAARQKRQRIEAQTKLDRRAKTARKAVEQKRVPPVVAGGKAMAAENSAAKMRATMNDREAAAAAQLAEAQAAVRDVEPISIDLPDSVVPAGRTLLELDAGEVMLSIRGPERIALTGANGSGKTTLLAAIVAAADGSTADAAADDAGFGGADAAAVTRGGPGRPRPVARVQMVTPAIGTLDQRITFPDPQASVLETVRAAAPHTDPHAIRAQLAGLQLKKDRPDQPVGQLSGGERFRVALAGLLLADPAPQLLVLDEPTNNLDLDSLEVLTAALNAYAGALIVVSHDERFLTEIGVGRYWEIRHGTLREE